VQKFRREVAVAGLLGRRDGIVDLVLRSESGVGKGFGGFCAGSGDGERIVQVEYVRPISGLGEGGDDPKIFVACPWWSCR
jgi:hypothetical protein